ncbi:MAG: hypothetical protein Q9166_007496 [cf. Caloplaca sp. 2 TL-2023]
MVSIGNHNLKISPPHPIIFYILENLVTILTIGFTSAESLLRLALLPILILAAYPVVLSCPTILYRYTWAGLVGGNIITSLFNYLEVAILSRWSFETKAPTTFPTPGDSILEDQNKKKILEPQSSTFRHDFWKRLRFGYFVTTSSRNIGTPYIVKNTPSFFTADPEYIPSRWSFCVRKVCILLLTFLIIDLASQESQPLEVNARTIAEEKVHILTGIPDNLSPPQILTRLATVLGYWFCTAIVIDAFSSAFNLVSVALNVEDVEAYRPNFGSVAEAYTVRQFWGVTWHQHLRKQLCAPASVIVYHVLGLKKGTLLARYTHLTTVLLISGLLHTWVEVGQGFTWQESGQLHFFKTQVMGIILEDTVQWVYYACRGVQRGNESTPIRRAVGYIWVTIFLWWSTPAWFYPRLRTSEGDVRDKLLPFSLIARLRTG